MPLKEGTGAEREADVTTDIFPLIPIRYHREKTGSLHGVTPCSLVAMSYTNNSNITLSYTNNPNIIHI